jgi:hypothetical protein
MACRIEARYVQGPFLHRQPPLGALKNVRPKVEHTELEGTKTNDGWEIKSKTAYTSTNNRHRTVRGEVSVQVSHFLTEILNAKCLWSSQDVCTKPGKGATGLVLPAALVASLEILLAEMVVICGHPEITLD